MRSTNANGLPFKKSAVADKSDAERLGRDLAAELLDLGAGALPGPGRDAR